MVKIYQNFRIKIIKFYKLSSQKMNSHIIPSIQLVTKLNNIKLYSNNKDSKKILMFNNNNKDQIKMKNTTSK